MLFPQQAPIRSSAGIASWQDLRSLKLRHQSASSSTVHTLAVDVGQFNARVQWRAQRTFFGSSDSVTNAGFLNHFGMASSSWLRCYASLNSLSEIAPTSSAGRRTNRSSGPCARWRSMKYATKIPCASEELRQSRAARRNAPAAPWGRAPPVVFC
jgi:hypothetical protein